ncbi:MAG: ribosome recycling factor [Bacteroidia bacterium]|nr:MAG: ribosome recycling factor [Bacteroidia bacterium]
MNEEVQMLFDILEENLNKSTTHLQRELLKLRAGKANPHMLSSITVENYGAQTPLNQLANVGTMDAQTIVVQPWDKNMLPAIEKEIQKANLGFNPQNNGERILINVPPLTEERRRELVKFVKAEEENCKISVRSNRREAMDGVKDLKTAGLSEDEQKRTEAQIQEKVDEYIKKIEEIIKEKEKEIMTI